MKKVIIAVLAFLIALCFSKDDKKRFGKENNVGSINARS